jgi:hypothetical protein
MKNLAIIAVMGLATLATVMPAQAARHPRVREVKGRLGRQNRRINAGVRDGQLTHSQAQTLRQDDHQIHQEMHTMRENDNGHLTSADKTSLNQQLNENSQSIFSDRHSTTATP